nr:MAG TPA: hypothetical protein [Caudoviricetes sp.]DAS89074.1 MAG TPA: hypothetical protein [Caudoviricetes sp.]
MYNVGNKKFLLFKFFSMSRYLMGTAFYIAILGLVGMIHHK